MGHDRLLKDILVLLIVAMIGYMGFRAYKVYEEVKSDKISQEAITTGMDTELTQTVRTMEKDLTGRRSYHYAQKKDPMDATGLIPFDFSDIYDFRELMERQKILRLSCTIVDDNPSAIIKYMGQSHILHIGESINGKKVTEITQKAVKFSDGSILESTSAPTLQQLMSERSS